MINFEFFSSIHDFNNQKLTIDWYKIFQNEESTNSFFEILDLMQQSLSLMPEVPHDKRISLVGRLAITRAQLDYLLTTDINENEFEALTTQTENILREVLALDFWLKQAQERLPLFEETVAKSSQPSQENSQFIFFQPVLLAISLISLINLAQDSEENEDSQSEVLIEECEDDECDPDDTCCN